MAVALLTNEVVIMLDTRKHGQFVVDVISEMLDETKRVAENCSVGTTNDDVPQAIYEEIARRRIPENLYLPRSYAADILEESYELVTNAELEKLVLRRMFRSVWDTAYSVKSHIENFIKDPRRVSLRNALVMQRDLIDKIIDIPYIHRSGKGHQYLDFYTYVSAPQKMLDILPDIFPTLVERGEDIIGDTMLPTTRAILDPILLRLNIRRSVGLSGIDEQDVTTISGVFKILVESHAKCTELNNRIRDAREHHSEDDVLALTKEWTFDLVEGLRRDMMHQLIAVFVRKYYHDDWGNWLDIPPDDQKKKLRGKLNSWTKLRQEQKLPKGLIPYIEDGFYNGGITEHCARLPYKYHLHSLHVHDSIWDSTHNKQEWEESSNSADILDVLLDGCASAIYVASVHYYDCAGIRHELKLLRRILRKVEEQSTA